MLSVRTFLLSLIVIVSPALLAAQDLNEEWATNFAPAGVSGTVKALKKWGDTLVVAGAISGLRITGASSPGFLMFDLVDRSWKLQSDDQMDFGDEVRAVEMMPNGDLVVGGDFSFESDGMTLENIALYRTDGTWSTLSGDTSDFCNGPVNALLEFDGRLYIGGEFQSFGDTDPDISYLFAIWDGADGFFGTSNEPIGFATNPQDNPAIYALEQIPGSSGIPFDNNIYVGGNFLQSPGDTLGNLVRVSTFDRFVSKVGGGGTNGPVYALKRPAESAEADKLFIGGDFTNAGGLAVQNCVMYDGTWNPLGDGLNGPVYAIKQYPAPVSPMHFAGDFDSSGSTPVGATPGWNYDSESWAPTELTTQGPINALESIQGNFLAVGGDFEFAGDSSLFYGVFYTEEWDEVNDSVLWSLGDAIEHYATSFERANDVAANDYGDFYVTGGFDFAGGALVNYIARWDGEKWYPLGAGLASAGFALAVNGDTVYVAGGFAMAGGIAVNEIAMWNGLAWSDMAGGLPGADIDVMAIDTLGHLYVGGRNLDANGTYAANGLIRWDGTQWLPVGDTMRVASGVPRVYDMYIDSLTNHVWVCGRLHQIGGDFVNNVARWDGNDWRGYGDSDIGDGLPEVIERSPEGDIIVNGAIQRPEFRRLINDSLWIAYAGGISTPDVKDLLTIGCHVYLTGDPLQFVNSEADPVRVPNIGKWDGLAWDSLGNGTNGGVSNLASFENQLAVAGDHTRAGGHFSRGFSIWNGVIDGAGASDLTLLSPTSNDTLTYGTVFEFTWDTATTAELVAVEVSLDSGATWEIIHNRADAKLGRLPWVVPDTNAPFCMVRVADGDSPCAVVTQPFTFAITADSALESWWLTHAGGTYYDEPFLPGYTGFQFDNSKGNMWPDSLWKSIDYSDFPDPPDTIENFPDWYLYCDAYGDDWCYRNGNPDRPRSRAIKHWQAIVRKWGGSCLGFSKAALLWLYGNDFNTDLIIPYEPLYYLDYNTLTRNAANKHWIYQNGEKHIEHDDEAVELTPFETMVLIRDDFTASFARSLSFSWMTWEDKLDDDSVVIDSVLELAGHNVVPYHIRNVPDSQGIYYIYFYDSNDPTSMNRWARIDSINNVWRMSHYQLNDTTSRFIPRLPINEWYGLANDDRVTSGLKRSASSHHATVYTSAREAVLMTDTAGNQIGWMSGGPVVNGIDGGPIYPDDPDYSYEYPPGYFLPAGTYDIELSNHDGVTPRFSMFTDSVSYFYRRNTAGTSVTDRFRFGDGISIIAPTGLLPGVSVGTIQTTDSSERYIELSEMTFAPIDSVAIDFDSTGAITISSTGINRAYKLLLWNSEASMTEDEYVQTPQYTTILAGETHKILPAWGMLESMPLLLLKDTDQDGLFEDTSVLAIATDIDIDTPELPDTYTLSQNYPNPFNPSTSIDFSLPVAGEVTLEVINLLGQRVITLVDKELSAGSYTVEWDSRNSAGESVASGVYFYRLSTDGYAKSRKMLLLK